MSDNQLVGWALPTHNSLEQGNYRIEVGNAHVTFTFAHLLGIYYCYEKVNRR